MSPLTVILAATLKFEPFELGILVTFGPLGPLGMLERETVVQLVDVEGGNGNVFELENWLCSRCEIKNIESNILSKTNQFMQHQRTTMETDTAMENAGHLTVGTPFIMTLRK